MSVSPRLRSREFRLEHEQDWRRLEGLLKRLEDGSLARLSEREIVELPALYRSALSSLTLARAISLDLALVEYLESLCVRAYFAVYGERKSPREMIARFFVRDWPAAVVALQPEILISALLLLGGAVAGYLLVRSDPAWFSALLSGQMAGGRSPAASADALRAVLAINGRRGALGPFATFLFTHNAQIAFSAFALGALACVPCALLILQNGLGVGALVEIYAAKGLAAPLMAWLLIHGVTELSAVVLAAGAGIRLGRTLLFPGRLSRLDALRTEGRTAAIALLGVVCMLFVAGLLEGFGRQLIQGEGPRFAVAAATGVLWGLYLLGPLGRGR